MVGLRSVLVVGAVAVAVALTSSGATSAPASLAYASGSTAYVSIPALVSGHGYDETVLGSGRHSDPMAVTVDFGGSPVGPTSNVVVIGRPGTTPDAADSGTAAGHLANQIPTTTTLEPTAFVVRFTPSGRGTYPVFVFSSGDLGCSVANMADETIDFTITQVGVVRIA